MFKVKLREGYALTVNITFCYNTQNLVIQTFGIKKE